MLHCLSTEWRLLQWRQLRLQRQAGKHRASHRRQREAEAAADLEALTLKAGNGDVRRHRRHIRGHPLLRQIRRQAAVSLEPHHNRRLSLRLSSGPSLPMEAFRVPQTEACPSRNLTLIISPT